MKGAVFGGKLSGDDYSAIMNYARITPPSVKENYVDIAGGDSSIDLTEAVGGVVFDDGSMEFKFTLFDADRKEQMKNDLHGRKMQIILERDPDFYYEGRVKCTSDLWVKGLYELCFTARVKPYKYEKRETIHNETLNGETKEIILKNTRMPVIPRITVTGDLYITFEGTKYGLKTGAYEIPEITLYDGNNRLKLSGTGTVRFIYRKGRLI